MHPQNGFGAEALQASSGLYRLRHFSVSNNVASAGQTHVLFYFVGTRGRCNIVNPERTGAIFKVQRDYVTPADGVARENLKLISHNDIN